MGIEPGLASTTIRRSIHYTLTSRAKTYGRLLKASWFFSRLGLAQGEANSHFLSVALHSDVDDLDAVLLEQLPDVLLLEAAGVVADVDLIRGPASSYDQLLQNYQPLGAGFGFYESSWRNCRSTSAKTLELKDKEDLTWAVVKIFYTGKKQKYLSRGGTSLGSGSKARAYFLACSK